MDSRYSLIRAASDQLAAARVEDPVHYAELLLTRLLGVSRGELRLEPQAQVVQELADRYRDWATRFAAGEPLAYIEGIAGFRNLELVVDSRVLVPRADSETVVEAVLQDLAALSAPRVLDVCTGSGCLLLALLDEHPGATGWGTDLSADALDVARLNAERTNLAARAEFRQASYLGEAGESAWGEGFDVIVSNPPYIARGEELGPGVFEYEPHLALFAPAHDPLAPYKQILDRAALFLAPDAHLVFEVGAGRAEEVAQLGGPRGFTHLRTHRDLGGIERAVVFRRAFAV